MANAYKKAGVNIEAGYETVGRIKKHVQRTFALKSWADWAASAVQLICLN
ncbi:hypothetical protein NBRC111894_1268 [Sporolactobacillus inulinus]|uniref:Uncharacterized protein n=1 Tax=Sporolactobacillus inulinus TaxID=2078 RepID=A0A4Y1Z9L5_9BACL|nr:hypothetical protein NBRC111894_1268 [Sporolactobacillus inulinus]